MSSPLVFSRSLQRPPVGQDLRALYKAWLSTPAPYSARGGNVAGSKTRQGVEQGARWAAEFSSQWDEAQQAFASEEGKVWVWSDLHLFHKNILRYAQRPFFHVDHMLEMLLSNAQAQVGPEDWLICLGDLSFGEQGPTADFVQALPGRKGLILGNHDVDRQPKLQGLTRLGFDAIADVQDWAVGAGLHDQDGLSVERLWLTHYPIWSPWLPLNVRNVHGHVHQHTVGGRCINASVEHTAYAPVLLRDLVKQHRVEPLVNVLPEDAED